MTNPCSEQELINFIYYIFNRKSTYPASTKLMVSLHLRDNDIWSNDDIRLRDYPSGKNLTITITI